MNLKIDFEFYINSFLMLRSHDVLSTTLAFAKQEEIKKLEDYLTKHNMTIISLRAIKDDNNLKNFLINQVGITDKSQVKIFVTGLKKTLRAEIDIHVVEEKMKDKKIGVHLADRKLNLATYKNCFVGSEAVDWMIKVFKCSRSDAFSTCKKLWQIGCFENVSDVSKPFLDGNYLYTFTMKSSNKPNKTILEGWHDVNTKDEWYAAWIMLDKEKCELHINTTATKNYNDLLTKMLDKNNGVCIQDRTYYFKTYKNCCVGQEVVSWLVKNHEVPTRENAICLLNELMEEGLFYHVTGDHIAKDANLYYRLSDKGNRSEKSKGLPIIIHLKKCQMEIIPDDSKGTVILKLFNNNRNVINTPNEHQESITELPIRFYDEKSDNTLEWINAFFKSVGEENETTNGFRKIPNSSESESKTENEHNNTPITLSIEKQESKTENEHNNTPITMSDIEKQETMSEESSDELLSWATVYNYI